MEKEAVCLSNHKDGSEYVEGWSSAAVWFFNYKYEASIPDAQEDKK